MENMKGSSQQRYKSETPAGSYGGMGNMRAYVTQPSEANCLYSCPGGETVGEMCSRVDLVISKV